MALRMLLAFSLFVSMNANLVNKTCYTTALDTLICTSAEDCKSNCTSNCQFLDPTEIYNIRAISSKTQEGNISDVPGLTPFVGNPGFACDLNFSAEFPHIKIGATRYFTRPNCDGSCQFECEAVALNKKIEEGLVAQGYRGILFLPHVWYTVIVASGSVLGGLLVGLLIGALCARFCCRKSTSQKTKDEEKGKQTKKVDQQVTNRYNKLNVVVPKSSRFGSSSQRYAPLANHADEQELSKSAIELDKKESGSDYRSAENE
ncbi:hypothetical protein M3Y96_00379800 [Aphelenchoides besseyi]|nr:hypothetical protein M3Y96_00379800 [Aphelenchoides besseyi]